MTHLPKGAPKPDEFRARAREAFAFLRELGFREEPVPSGRNPVAVWFASDVARVAVEGISWGLRARVALGRAGDPAAFENYDLGDLLAARGSLSPTDSEAPGQLEQLRRLAAVLRAYGADVLAGDFAVFPEPRARVEQRGAEFGAHRNACWNAYSYIVSPAA